MQTLFLCTHDKAYPQSLIIYLFSLLTRKLGNAIIRTTRKLGKGVDSMNKDEILEKSRAESRGHVDEMEQAALGRAGSIAAAVGGLVCMLILLLDFISKNSDPKVAFAAWSVYGLMQGVQFLVKYVKLRRMHELVFTILFMLIGVTAFAFLAYWLLAKPV